MHIFSSVKGCHSAWHAFARRHRHFSSVAGRLSEFIVPASDLKKSTDFMESALSLKKGQRVSAKKIKFPDSHCAMIVLRETEVAFPPKDMEEYINNLTPTYPFLSVGVSNLQTSMRQALRKGGYSKFTGEDESLFVDPALNVYRVLHLFRRNPIISVTLGVPDVRSYADKLRKVFGLNDVKPEEMADVHMDDHFGTDSSSSTTRIALTFSKAFNTTSLILEPLGSRGSCSPNLTDNAPIVTIEVQDYDGTRARAESEGFLVSDLDSEDVPSFFCVDDIGYVFIVRKLE